jgi:hypothetical protein
MFKKCVKLIDRVQSILVRPNLEKKFYLSLKSYSIHLQNIKHYHRGQWSSSIQVAVRVLGLKVEFRNENHLENVPWAWVLLVSLVERELSYDSISLKGALQLE